MDESADVACESSALFEYPDRHHGFLCDVLLVGPESDHAEYPDDERGNHIGGLPWEDDSPGSQSEEEGSRAADEENHADDVDVLQFLFQ
jgi:hypothetical protein